MVKEKTDVSPKTWAEFVTEFKRKCFNLEAMRAQQSEFLNLKQGRMTIIEAVRKFERLKILCHFLKLDEGEKIHRMLKCFTLKLQNS